MRPTCRLGPAAELQSDRSCGRWTPTFGPNVNSGSADLLQFQISGASARCEEVRARGFNSFEQLAEHVRLLPYGRTGNKEDPCAVLREGRGTCSSKHQLLAAVAHDCGHSDVHLTVGIYEMCEANTPGVGAVLSAAFLTSIPEAHCYLTVEGERLDFTGLGSGVESPFESLVAEQVVAVSSLVRIKTGFHKEALASWAHARGLTEGAAWATREACIAALAPNASIERTCDIGSYLRSSAAHVKR